MDYNTRVITRQQMDDGAVSENGSSVGSGMGSESVSAGKCKLDQCHSERRQSAQLLSDKTVVAPSPHAVPDKCRVT